MSLIAYNSVRKFYIIYLPECYLNCKILSIDSNLQIPVIVLLP